MSYLRYLCLFTYNGVQHILCSVFLFCLSSFCVPDVANFSGVSILDLPFRFSLTFIYILASYRHCHIVMWLISFIVLNLS